MPDARRSPATKRTRRRLLVGGVAALVATAGVGRLSARTSTLSEPLAATWVAVTSLAVVGLWAYTYAFAAENASDDEETGYATVGLPTGVTLLRGTAAAGLAGIAAVVALASPPDRWAWVAAAVYGLVAALDSVDGFLARRLRRTTRLGGRLDTAVDAFGILVASLAGVVLGELPWWYLAVGVARYAFVAGIWWRDRTDRPTFDLPPRSSRRVLAGVQMAVIPAALAPGVADGAMPVVVGVAAAGVLGGFGRDWLYVSGRLESGASNRPTVPTRE